MSEVWKCAAFAMLGATVTLIVSAASAGAGAARGPEIRVRIERASQKEILARGLEVRVSNKGTEQPIVKVRGFSSTFDVPDFSRLTKTRVVRLRGARASAPSQRVKVVRLRLTAEGRKQIESCEGRTLRVEAGDASDQAKLVATRGDASRSRSTSGVPIVATSSANRTDRSACYRSPTTITRSPIPRPQPGAGSISKPRRCRRTSPASQSTPGPTTSTTASAPGRRSCS
ncbi:MAG: hypothetical protein ACREA0_20825, partial [bacterium]